MLRISWLVREGFDLAVYDFPLAAFFFGMATPHLGGNIFLLAGIDTGFYILNVADGSAGTGITRVWVSPYPHHHFVDTSMVELLTTTSSVRIRREVAEAP